MKKLTLFAISLIITTTTIQASPRFGITGISNGGVGITAVDTKYTVSLVGSHVKNKKGIKGSNQTNIELNAKYKLKMDELTYATIGARYVAIQLKNPEDDDTDEESLKALTAGIERQFSDRVLLFVETDIYATQDKDDAETVVKIFKTVRTGVSFVF